MAKKKPIPQIVKDIRAFKPNPPNWAQQKIISYSQLSMYTECPKKWSLQYKEGHKQFTSNIHTVFGTALHEVLQHYLNVMYEVSGAEADRIEIYDMFQEKLREEYTTQYKKNNNQHFSTPQELRQFFEEGKEIIRDFSKNKGKYFSKKGWHLVGCEIPVQISPVPSKPHVIFNGFLDVVMYHEITDTIKIIDIKTSRQGWNKSQKQDELKQFQLILYKKFLSDLFDIDPKKIEIEYFIVKRQVYEHEDYVIKRIQTFSPPSGKIKIKKSTDTLYKFISEAFDQNHGYKEVDLQPTPNDKCKWCPFHKTHLCSATFTK